MTKGINSTEIEAIVDDYLAKMFIPKANVNNDTKAIIKAETLKLSQYFIDIIDTFNQNVYNDSYVDRVLSKMDLFALNYEKLLNAIINKNIAGSVGAIWYAFFTTAHSELKDNISDKMLFEWSGNKINKMLLERIRR